MFGSGSGAPQVWVRSPRSIWGHVRRPGRLIYAHLVALVFVLGGFGVNAAACEGGGGGGAELTSLSTKLSGGAKEGEELTVVEGTKVKDKGTLTGKNASTATGKVTYKVYSDKECKTLVKEAGEVTVSGESVPASSEEELEAGKTYYWQAHYSGDSKNDESTSPCTEILYVQAKTALATKLSGEGKEGEELTIFEGSKAKDKATLSGTNSSSASGKVVYKVYSDKECKTLVEEAGNVTVSSGSVPASDEEELEGEATYYWQAAYSGDALHEESKSECGKEVLKVKLPRPEDGEKACVRTLPEGPSNCEPPITPGVTIESEIGGKCTAGAIAIPTKEPLKKEKSYLLTAGHCIADGGGNGELYLSSGGRNPGGRANVQKVENPNCEEKAGLPWWGEKWYAYTRAAPAVQVEIGRGGSWEYTNNDDYGEICITNKAWMTKAKKVPVWAVIAEWAPPEEQRFLVEGLKEMGLKGEAYLEGQRTGHQHGEVTEVPVGATNFVKVENGNVKSLPGDSGGPWYERVGSGLAWLAGLHAHVLVGKIGVGEPRYYENLKAALAGLGALNGFEVELLTTANEVR